MTREIDGISSRAFERVRPSVLCHYTPQVETVAKILAPGTDVPDSSTTSERQVIWAPDCKVATEGEQDLDIATSMVLSLLGEFEETLEGWASLFKAMRCTFDEMKISKVARVYVACLTEEPDNAKMWASKFGGHGCGASIAFRMLDEVVPDLGFSAQLFQVEYDMTTLKSELRSLITAVVGAAQKCGLDDEVVEKVQGAVYRVAAIAAVRSKEEAARFQREWRVAIIPPPNCPELQILGGTKPRLNWPLRAKRSDLAEVTRIVLGPNVIDPERRKMELRGELARAGYGDEASQPYLR